jgi:DNA-binding response OmpR family regulator
MTNQKKLLVIDDDPDYLESIKSTLEIADYSVQVAHNPKVGFQLLQSQVFDLLVLDIMMGRGAEGVVLARKIRKVAKLHDIPILIITSIREQIAFVFPKDQVNADFIDLAELIEKPVEPKLLLEKIAGLLLLSEEKNRLAI